MTSWTFCAEDEGHPLAKLRRDVFGQVLAVALRQDDRLDPGPLRRQHLLFDAADRQHFPRKRHLAGHCQRGLDWTARQQGTRWQTSS